MFKNSVSIKQVEYWFPKNTKKIFKTELNKINWHEISAKIDDTYENLQLNRMCRINYNEILISGGVNSNSDEMSKKVYYFKSDQVCRKADMINQRSIHATTIVGNFIYVCGGQKSYGCFISECERYDIQENKWSPITNMNYGKFVILLS